MTVTEQIGGGLPAANAATTCSTVCTTMPPMHWISSLFRPILGFFRMSDTPSAYQEFPSTAMEVKVWEKQLFDSYRTRDDTYRLMNDVVIPKISLYKADSALQHEHLVAATRRKRKATKSLRLERWRQQSDRPGAEGVNKENETAAPRNRGLGGSLQHPSSLSSMSSSLSSSDRDAYDTVSVVEGIPPGCTLVKTVTFGPKNTPTLFQLAIAASAVNHDSPRYHLFDRQCYWFADVLLRVLERTYKAGDSDNVDPDEDDEVQVPLGVNVEEFLRGITEGTLDDHSGYAKGGKWSFVRIYAAKQKVIKRVTKDYRKRLQSRQAEVEEGYRRRAQLQIAEARLQREQQEREAELREHQQREAEREAQLQREREEHQDREARLERERDEEREEHRREQEERRDREAQLERERDEQLQREREERRREQEEHRDREAQLERERDEQLQREREERQQEREVFQRQLELLSNAK